MNRLLQIFERIESQPYHPARLFIIVFSVGIGRAAEEVFLAHKSLSLNAASHYASFYLATFFVFNAIASIVMKIDWRKTSQFVLYGIFVGLVPPVIDAIWIGPGRFGYSYLDGFYPTLHGARNPYSEAIAAWSALITFALYVFLRSRSFWKSLLSFVLAYVGLVALVSLTPEAIGNMIAPIKSGTAKTFLYLLISYTIYVLLNWDRFKPSLKRINHSLPWVLLVFLGASLADGIQKMTWMQGLLVLFLHQGIVFANDYYDRESDALNERPGRIQETDVFILHVLLIWIASHVGLVNAKLGFLYYLYILLTTAYHHPSIRLKDHFPLNYVTEGLVASLALMVGMASSGQTQLSPEELAYVGLAFIGFASASPFKDYKDLEGDRASGTKTIYVLLSQRGWKLSRIHMLVTCIVLIFMSAPLYFLHIKNAPQLLILILATAFVVPAFLTLRMWDKKSAVELTAWLLTAYLTALTASLVFAVPSIGQGALKDYGALLSGAVKYDAVHPESSEEIINAVRRANTENRNIRVRGNGHSMNGLSLPRDGELTIFTDKLRQYHLEEPGSITVGSGVGMHELRTFLSRRGYSLPVTPDGIGGPTVGGYIAAGGIGAGSRRYGGFWENVQEITMITGTGDLIKAAPGDELFPWMFGSMGQLGVFASAKLKILGGETRSYPLGEKGIVPIIPMAEARRLVWFTVFVPKNELDEAQNELMKIKDKHSTTLEYRPDYVYPMTFLRFNPKLVFPLNEDFVGVGIWGYPKSSDPESLLAIENEVTNLVVAHKHDNYRRYIQTEIVSPKANYRLYFGDSLYEEFESIKKKLDPQFRMNCGTVFPCSGSRQKQD